MGVCNGPGEWIIYSGFILSTFGYCFLILTALFFPSWRSHPVNQVWLYMCGTKLAFVYLVTFYTLIYCKRSTVRWMESDTGYFLFWGLSDYFMLVTSSWMVAGAWLAHRQLVVVLPEDGNPRYMLKASLFSWLTPIPLVVTRSLIWRPVRPADFVSMLPIIYQVMLLVNLLCSIGMYCHVLYSLCRSARDSGRGKNILGTTVLALVFLLTSGVQYVIVIVTSKYYKKKCDPHFVQYSIVLWLVLFSVFIYSILFVVGIKHTRRLWCGLICASRQKPKIEVT